MNNDKSILNFCREIVKEYFPDEIIAFDLYAEAQKKIIRKNYNW